MGEVVNIRDYKRKEEKKLIKAPDGHEELVEFMMRAAETPYVAPDKDTSKSHNEMILDRMKGVPANVASANDPTIFGDPNIYAAPEKDPA